jgi:hypothetical protein
MAATLETKNVCIAAISLTRWGCRMASSLAPEPDRPPQWGSLLRAFIKPVEHHSKESTVHRFEPARPRNKAQDIAANTE